MEPRATVIVIHTGGGNAACFRYRRKPDIVGGTSSGLGPRSRAKLTEVGIIPLVCSLGGRSRDQFCSCDFEVESVAERLNQSGFSCAERSLVIWLDVSYYLSAERFELALDEIASFSAPGSRLVLDYMDQEVIDGTTSFRGARRAADWVAKRGEPYALGFSPEDITRAVEERGYRVNDHVRVTEPARRYRPPASVWCETDDFMGIVSAERTTLGGSSGQPVDKP